MIGLYVKSRKDFHLSRGRFDRSPRLGARWLTEEGLREIARFATGIGPAKRLLDGRPDVVQMAHSAGLTVTPYTFTTRAPVDARFGTVTNEMRYFLFDLGVDAVFTDNPDQFPR